MKSALQLILLNGFRFVVIASLWLLTGLTVVAAEPLIERWSLQNVFNMPESAAYDPHGKQIFVSNVNHYAKDGNGFISRVSADGKEVEVEWLTGLNSPTGLAVNNGLLYAGDFDALVIIDIARRKILQRIQAPDDKPSLNDVAISDAGQVFVSGSNSSSIYMLKDDELVVWKHDPERLKYANGLLVDGQRLIHGGLHWSVFDLASRQLVDDFKAPGAAIKDVDGITRHPDGGYLVSLIDDKRLWHISEDGSSQPVSEQQINGIDIQQYQGRLYVPVVGGGLSVFSW